MVRFFEKKKVIRNLKGLNTELNELKCANADKKILKKHRRKIRHAEIDLCYVFLFPKTEKYISLFPNIKEEDKKDPNAEIGWKKTEKQRLEFKKEVEKIYEEGKLPFKIEDVLVGKTIKINNAKAVINEEIDAPQAKVEEDDEFFE
ncbi:unnamed protein product [Candida verbasci]|uniref:rRNA-processing protein EFG1 n=1 Tax=Candida verbasci TaxID=1227364 RepID=A0A9W4U043_9ASCO|nr:unnamed protein product [Candida verbasci]